MVSRLAAEEKQTNQLQQRNPAQGSGGPAAAGAVSNRFPGGGPGAGSSVGLIDYRPLANNPEFRKLQVSTSFGLLDARYAPLFSALGLEPGRLLQFKNVLVEKQISASDAIWAASDQGVRGGSDLGPLHREEFRGLVQQESCAGCCGTQLSALGVTVPYLGDA